MTQTSHNYESNASLRFHSLSSLKATANSRAICAIVPARVRILEIFGNNAAVCTYTKEEEEEEEEYKNRRKNQTSALTT